MNLIKEKFKIEKFILSYLNPGAFLTKLARYKSDIRDNSNSFLETNGRFQCMCSMITGIFIQSQFGLEVLNKLLKENQSHRVKINF